MRIKVFIKGDNLYIPCPRFRSLGSLGVLSAIELAEIYHCNSCKYFCGSYKMMSRLDDFNVGERFKQYMHALSDFIECGYKE